MKLVTIFLTVSLLSVSLLIAPTIFASGPAEEIPSCNVQPIAEGPFAAPAFLTIAPISCVDECDAERFACFAGCSNFFCYDACLTAFNACIIRC